MQKIKLLDTFAGIGGCHLGVAAACKEFGIDFECVGAIEFNKQAQQTYSSNFPNTTLLGMSVGGDITKMAIEDVPEYNMLIGGFPCQPFSISGNQLGFADTRGTLFFNIASMLKAHTPELVLLENVKNLLSHNKGRTLEVVLATLKTLDYTVFFKVLRSSDYGIPQARERIYIAAFKKTLDVNTFEFPAPSSTVATVKSILQKPSLVPKECYVTRTNITYCGKEKDIVDKRNSYLIGRIGLGRQGERIYSIYGSGITLSSHGGGVASKTGAYLVGKKVRKLTPRECARLQGFPESYKLPKSLNCAYTQFGNSVTVSVISAIVAQMLSSIA